MIQKTKRFLRNLTYMLVILSLMLPSITVQAGEKRIAKVMTQNLYFGADLTPVIMATDLNTFITQATLAWQNALNTNIPDRMDAMLHKSNSSSPTS